MKDFIAWTVDSGNICGSIVLMFSLFALVLFFVIIAIFYPLAAVVVFLLLFGYILYRAIKDYRNDLYR